MRVDIQDKIKMFVCVITSYHNQLTTTVDLPSAAATMQSATQCTTLAVVTIHQLRSVALKNSGNLLSKNKLCQQTITPLCLTPKVGVFLPSCPHLTHTDIFKVHFYFTLNNTV